MNNKTRSLNIFLYGLMICVILIGGTSSASIASPDNSRDAAYNVYLPLIMVDKPGGPPEPTPTATVSPTVSPSPEPTPEPTPDPTPECPQTGLWQGITSQGHRIRFTVEDTPSCQVAEGLRIKIRDSCHNVINYIETSTIAIYSGHFGKSYSNFILKGHFSSESEADGTFEWKETWGLWCSAEGTWSAKPNTMLNNTVSALVEHPDDEKILVGGWFSEYGQVPRKGLAQFGPNGDFDPDFDPDLNGSVTAIAIQDDGKILIGGNFTEAGGQVRNYIARLNRDGSLDTSFNADPNDRVDVIAIQQDGKILIGGYFTEVEGENRSQVARLNVDGSLDLSFVPGQLENTTFVDPSVRAIAVQPDTGGKILIGGMFRRLDGNSKPGLLRVNPDGSLDESFEFYDACPHGSLNSLALQSDGKIIIGGLISCFSPSRYVVRLNPNGSVDTSFHDPGNTHIVLSVAVDSEDRIMVGGIFTFFGDEQRRNIARFSPDGVIDPSFAPAANESVRPILVQGDGKILLGGSFTMLDGEWSFYFGRLNPDGSFDTTFMY